ncbi:RIIa domain-containing protein 1 isoform X2 [Desmodus rotundus]|uniref:RIIa domain-containing protein 1 isoform X2 n=1 Tax=Desmodus rotundus TaxID=9430 RepID=UPI0039E6E052
MAMQPGGLLAPDPGALSPAQLEQLRNFKIQTRIANEKYLRAHKEVELLLSDFFRHCVGFLHQKLSHSVAIALSTFCFSAWTEALSWWKLFESPVPTQ